MQSEIQIGMPVQKDLSSIKELADNHKKELGFVLRPAIQASIDSKCVLSARIKGKIVGFVRFHHRRDRVTKIYEICVEPSSRLRDVGKKLIEALKKKALHSGQREIALKCPENLSANNFYKRLGFEECGLEQGKKRRLVLWKYKA